MFRNALRGFWQALKTETNMVIHVVAAASVLVYLLFMEAEIYHFTLAYIAIFLVVSSELMNTAIERLCDFVEPGQDQEIRNIKDIAASSVLMNIILALIVGYIIWVKL